MDKKKLSIGFITLCLTTAFAFTSIRTQAEDFAGQEDKYIKLCSSSKLTNSQQKTCKEFNTYLNKKNKELSEESDQTKKEAKQTKETIENLEKEIAEYTKKIDDAKKELTYVNNNITSLNKQITEKKKLLEERLYSMQSSWNSNMWISYIYNSESITDFIRRIINIHEITSYENDLVKQLNADLTEVEKQKSTLSLLKQSLEKEQAKQKSAQEKYFALLKEQNNEIAANSSEISKNQESMEDIQKNLAAIQKASDASRVANVSKATPKKKKQQSQSNQQNTDKKDTNTQNTNDKKDTNNTDNNKQDSDINNTDNKQDTNTNNTDNKQDTNNTDNQSTSSEELGLAIANKALTRQGYMYVWGGSHSMAAIKNPNQTQFDCSGLVNWAHYQCGVNIGVQYTKSLLSCGKSVSRSDLQAGDIILFSSNGSSSGVHHVGIYIGGNRMVHAPSTGKPVQVADLSYSYWQKEWYTCRRLY